ncbi:small integral membrane protein 8 [Triplophysa dalaica]|uniref:small integral membrane protein 8 n=1 Tax=Triplophysa dalaica TaxID=1582913 RepID=UPI0024DF4BF9|nr:small integral membrane protein 8 [Triplophysa dalaica]
MCRAADGSGTGGKQKPGISEREAEYKGPGLRGVKTTSLFRAVNPELFIRPNKPVMFFGLVTISLCVGYLGYLHAIRDRDQQLYEAIDSDGETYMRKKTSRWD